jgi:hypothetical protein
MWRLRPSSSVNSSQVFLSPVRRTLTFFGGEMLAFVFDAVLELREALVHHTAGDLDVVGLVEMRVRIRNGVRPDVVVGE